MRMRILSAPDLERALPMAAAVECMKRAYQAQFEGRIDAPQRAVLEVPGGVGLSMPGHLPGVALGAKWVSVFPGNAKLGKPAIQGLVMLADPETGEPCALLDGTFLTAWRTAAASGAATDLLARRDVRIGAVIGAGAQGRTQVLALDTVRDFDEIRVASRGPSAARLVEELGGRTRARLVAGSSAAEFARGAEVVTLATDSSTPVLTAEQVDPGTHLNAVGSFRLDMVEMDPEFFRSAHVFVDDREAALEEAGELVAGIDLGATDPSRWTPLGEVVARSSAGRPEHTEPPELPKPADPGTCTYFKSVGLPVQDLAAAGEALEKARELGLGRELDLFDTP